MAISVYTLRVSLRVGLDREYRHILLSSSGALGDGVLPLVNFKICTPEDLT